MTKMLLKTILSTTATLFFVGLSSCTSGDNSGQTIVDGVIGSTEEKEWAMRVMDGDTIDDLINAWKNAPEPLGNEIHFDESLDRNAQATLAYWYTISIYGAHFAKSVEESASGKIGVEETSNKQINVARMLLGLPTLDVDEELVQLVHKLGNDMIAVARADIKWSERYGGWTGFWNSSAVGLFDLIEGSPPADQTSIAILRRDQAEYESICKELVNDLNAIQTMRHTLSTRNGFQFVRIWDQDLVTERAK